jgi:polysaccharide biosynthesis transport protein
MPDETKATLPPPQNGPTALQVRQATDVSTMVLSPAAEAAADEAIHFLDLWHIIVKRKWAVIAFFLFAVVTTLVATSLMTPIFRAAISIKIERDAPKVVKYEEVTPTEQTYDTDFYKTQYELLKSRTLAERVVEQLNLKQNLKPQAPEAAPWWSGFFPRAKTEASKVSADEAARIESEDAAASFLGSLTVEPVRNSRIVRLYFDSPDPKLAADALNALAQNFINVNLERRYEASSYAKTFLEEKIAQTKARLEDAERALVEFQRAQEIINVDDKQNVLAQTLAEFNTAAAKVEQERVKAESQYTQFNANPETSPQVIENRSIQVLKEQRAKMQTEYQDLLRIYKPAFPKMQQLQAGIEELDKKINEEVEVVRRSIEGSYKAVTAQETQIRARLEASKKSVLDLQDRSIQYNILKRDVETNRQFYDGLLQRLKEVGVAGGIGVNNVTVVDPADIPRWPSKPDLRRNLLIAMVLGLLGGVGLAFFLDYLDDRLHRPEDIERLTHLPILGVIPLVKREKVKDKAKDVLPLALEGHKDMRSAFAEAYRSVRTALQFSTRDGAPRQFVVTSSSAGEGKSTTALSLAINFAQAGRTVLLIDADMRNPSLHRTLGVEHDRGLSNCLSGDCPALAAIRTTSITNLFVMPSGPLPPNPVELLSGPKLLEMLAQLGDRFPQIILDGPPVLGLADAIVLGNQVGATLFVVAAGAARRANVRQAMKRLRQASVHTVGAVMTKMNLRDGAYGYESAYYYYRSTNDAPVLPRT